MLSLKLPVFRQENKVTQGSGNGLSEGLRTPAKSRRTEQPMYHLLQVQASLNTRFCQLRGSASFSFPCLLLTVVCWVCWWWWWGGDCAHPSHPRVPGEGVHFHLSFCHLTEQRHLILGCLSRHKQSNQVSGRGHWDLLRL